MNPWTKKIHTAIALLAWLASSACTGCSDADPADDCASGDCDVGPTAPPRMHDPEVDAFFAALPLTWAEPPPESDVTTELPAESGTEGEIQFECARTEHDVQRNFDSILALGDAYADVRPGMILQGARFRDGAMVAVPLRRAPIDLTIDLAVSQPVERVADPNSATLQTAVARLQREADAELGSLPDLPARVSYTSDTASSYDEAMLDVGVHVGYRSALNEAGLDVDLSTSRSRRSVTVVARLYQPMYTISIADDALAGERDFLAADVTRQELDAQQAAGTIGPDNLPVYVKSVTFGRVVIFTMTSEEVSSHTELTTLVSASFGNFEGDASLRSRYQEIVSRSTVRVLALGGPAGEANAAIQTGDYSRFFGPATALTGVPLSYRVQYLRGARATARLGNTLSYVTEDCDYRTPMTESIPFSGVVHESAGGSAPWSTGVSLQAGDTLRVSASGNIWGGVFATGCAQPDGWSENAPTSGGWPLPGGRKFSLIMRVGGGSWRYVGRSATFDASTVGTGRIEFGTNDDAPGNGDDCASAGLAGFHVEGTIQRTTFR